MRELGNGRGEHTRYAGIHSVAAMEVDTHACFGGILATRGDSAMRPARGMQRRLFELFPLGGAGYQHAEKTQGKLADHKTRLIISGRRRFFRPGY
jgi:hypothetical protein